jgi:cation:H+ antiporter
MLSSVSILDVVLVVVGLVLLFVGGEALVRGASTIATKAGVSPLVVGLVIVSAATSTPELAVTIDAVLQGEPGLAVGNVIGSNIANILLILGLSAAISPLVIRRQVVRFDIPVMVGISILLLAVSLDGRLGLWEGIALLAVLVIHAVMTVILGRRDAQTEAALADTLPLNATAVKLPIAILLLVVGTAILAVGARLLVTGAVNIATALGVSSLVVGLTVVAVATSLPELATSIVALLRGERDMAVGNIVGSNIFNIGMVLGLSAIIFGDGIPVPREAIALDMPIMVATALALLPIALVGFVVTRWEGIVFVALFSAYMAFVALFATQHAALSGFTTAMLWFVLPLLGVAWLATVLYFLATRKKRTGSDTPPSA